MPDSGDPRLSFEGSRVVVDVLLNVGGDKVVATGVREMK